MVLRRLLSGIFSLGLLTLAAVDAAAQQTANACAPFAQLSETLKQRYDESPTAFGLVENTSIMQLYASPESGTWSIVMTNRQGFSCIVAAGHSWEQIDPALTDPDA